MDFEFPASRAFFPGALRVGRGHASEEEGEMFEAPETPAPDVEEGGGAPEEGGDGGQEGGGDGEEGGEAS
jgi:hypothetical protein